MTPEMMVQLAMEDEGEFDPSEIERLAHGEWAEIETKASDGGRLLIVPKRMDRPRYVGWTHTFHDVHRHYEVFHRHVGPIGPVVKHAGSLHQYSDYSSRWSVSLNPTYYHGTQWSRVISAPDIEQAAIRMWNIILNSRKPKQEAQEEPEPEFDPEEIEAMVQGGIVAEDGDFPPREFWNGIVARRAQLTNLLAQTGGRVLDTQTYGGALFASWWFPEQEGQARMEGVLNSFREQGFAFRDLGYTQGIRANVRVTWLSEEQIKKLHEGDNTIFSDPAWIMTSPFFQPRALLERVSSPMLAALGIPPSFWLVDGMMVSAENKVVGSAVPNRPLRFNTYNWDNFVSWALKGDRHSNTIQGMGQDMSAKIAILKPALNFWPFGPKTTPWG